MATTVCRASISIFAAISMWLPFSAISAEKLELTDKYIFEFLDINDDQKISRPEYSAQRMMVFFLRDANRNGKLEIPELPIVSAKVFKSVDTDGDFKISGYEFNQAKVGMFDNLDVNSDGSIDFKEFLVLRKK